MDGNPSTVNLPTMMPMHPRSIPSAEQRRREVEVRTRAATLFIASYGGASFEAFIDQAEPVQDVRMTRLVRWLEHGDR